MAITPHVLDNVASSIQHIPTQEEIEQTKQNIHARAASEGAAIPLVFKAMFCNDQVQFICQWLDSAAWNVITSNTDYQKQLTENPEEADRFMRMKVFQRCVIWPAPPKFNPTLRDSNQPYPAGVLGALLDKIMFTSGFTNDVAPDRILIAPPEPREPTDEELTAIMRAHPMASRFGSALEKPFFMKSYNAELDTDEFIITRYYIYTTIDKDTYAQMKTETDDDTAMELVLDGCTLWPVPSKLEAMAEANPGKWGKLLETIQGFETPPERVTWGQEAAQNGEWLTKSIMKQSGFGMDPSTGIEIL